MLKGPGSTWSNGSLIPGIETTIEYIIKLVTKIQREGVLSITVRQEATDDLYQHFDEIHKHTVWQEECRSWFKNGKIKNRIYLWPGPVSLAASTMSNERLTCSDYPLLEDYQGTQIGRLRIQVQIQEQVCLSGQWHCEGAVDEGYCRFSTLRPYCRHTLGS